MNTPSFLCFNGQILPADQPIFRSDNRGYRYGDGIFETMKMVNHQIPLFSYHFDRLSDGLQLLKYEVPPEITSQKLIDEIKLLSERNSVSNLCRVRLSAYRDINNGTKYIIECFPETSLVNELNENGFVIGLYPGARKSCDTFSNLKSANYLPYVMA
ncbi:MAG: aminotransferase class IV, partial [Chitinophagaceae bacterium]